MSEERKTVASRSRVWRVAPWGATPTLESFRVLRETEKTVTIEIPSYRGGAPSSHRKAKDGFCFSEREALQAFADSERKHERGAKQRAEQHAQKALWAESLLLQEAPVADSTSKTVRVRVADLIPVLRMAVRARSAEALLSRRMSYIDDGYGSRTVRAEREAIDAHFASFPKAVPLAWADACWELARELPAKSGGDKAVEALELIHERGCSWYADDSFTPEGTCLETDPEEVESQMCPACVAEAALNASTPLPLPSAPTVEAEVKP